MMRRVIREKDLSLQATGKLGVAPAAPAVAPTTGLNVDDYTSKLLKYIPAETVAGFAAVNGILAAVPNVSQNFYWLVFVSLLLLTAGYAWKSTEVQGLSTAYLQIVIQTVAFAIWVFSLGGPFAFLSWYKQYYGSVFLILYTIFVPLVA